MNTKKEKVRKTDVIKTFKEKHPTWSDNDKLLKYIESLDGEYFSKNDLVKAINKNVYGYGSSIFNIIRDL